MASQTRYRRAMPDAIHNPHDKLFRLSFSKKEIASDFFKAYLPKAILKHLNLDKLELMSGSFVDEELRESQSDLIYKVPLRGKPAFLAIIFEHQSTQEPLMGLRLLDYKVKFWKQRHKENPKLKKLPPLFPLLLSQTKTPWKAPTAFQDLIEIKDPELKTALASYTPNFEYLVVDLNTFDEEHIMGNIWNHLVLSCMKAARNEKLLDFLKGLARFSEQIRVPSTLGLLEALLRYTFDNIGDEVNWRDLAQLTSGNIAPEVGEQVMTLAERLRQEGKQEGKQEGRQEGEAKGRQEGEAKGRQEGEAKGRLEALQETLIKMAAKRHGEDKELMTLIRSVKKIPVLENALDSFLESAEKKVLVEKLQS